MSRFRTSSCANITSAVFGIFGKFLNRKMSDMFTIKMQSVGLIMCSFSFFGATPLIRSIPPCIDERKTIAIFPNENKL